MRWAKPLAAEMARAFAGRVRRGPGGSRPAWPETEFAVKPTDRGSPIAIGVFDAQIASTPTLSYADDGTRCSFVCEACRITASLVQSH